MSHRAIRIVGWVVLALFATLVGWGAASLPLLDPDESRFARTTLEMQRAGDPVVPRFEGEFRLVKPPLLHWLQMALFQLFGAAEWVARLPAILASLGSLALAGWVGRRRFGPEGGLWTVVFLGTMPLVVALGRLGTLDALLAMHVLAVLALDLAGPVERRGARALAVGALLGLAFLVKGPVGVVLPLLVLLAGRSAAGEPLLPSAVDAGRAIAAWSGVVLPWGLAFLRRVGLGSAWEVMRGESLDRYLGGTVHVEPAWFYLGVLAVGLFPWVVPAAVAVGRAVIRRGDPISSLGRYLAAGLVIGVLFFSLGRSKLASYLLPLAPLVALLATWELGRQLHDPRHHRVAPLMMAAIQGAAAVGLGLFGMPKLDGAAAQVAAIGAVAHGLGALAMLAGVLRRRPRWVFGAAAASMFVFLACAVHLLVPEIARRRTSAYLVQEVPALSAGNPVISVAMKVPSLTWYLDRPVEEVPLHRLEARVAQPDAPLFVFDEDDLPQTPAAALERLEEIGRQGKYRVYRESERPPEASPDPLDPVRSRR